MTSTNSQDRLGGCPAARILVVEDDPQNRNSLAEILALWGYEAETASDGVEALEKIPFFRPTVIISDSQMPRMGGMGLLRALWQCLFDVNVILVSGHRSFKETIEAARLGAVDFMEKPLNLERLKAELSELRSALPERPQGPTTQ